MFADLQKVGVFVSVLCWDLLFLVLVEDNRYEDEGGVTEEPQEASLQRKK